MSRIKATLLQGSDIKTAFSNGRNVYIEFNESGVAVHDAKTSEIVESAPYQDFSYENSPENAAGFVDITLNSKQYSLMFRTNKSLLIIVIMAYIVASIFLGVLVGFRAVFITTFSTAIIAFVNNLTLDQSNYTKFFEKLAKHKAKAAIIHSQADYKSAKYIKGSIKYLYVLVGWPLIGMGYLVAYFTITGIILYPIGSIFTSFGTDINPSPDSLRAPILISMMILAVLSYRTTLRFYRKNINNYLDLVGLPTTNKNS